MVGDLRAVYSAVGEHRGGRQQRTAPAGRSPPWGPLVVNEINPGIRLRAADDSQISERESNYSLGCFSWKIWLLSAFSC